MVTRILHLHNNTSLIHILGTLLRCIEIYVENGDRQVGTCLMNWRTSESQEQTVDYDFSHVLKHHETIFDSLSYVPVMRSISDRV